MPPRLNQTWRAASFVPPGRRGKKQRRQKRMVHEDRRSPVALRRS